jgi:hypothetical protein
LAGLAPRAGASNTIYIVPCADPAKDKPAVVAALAKAAAKAASGYFADLGLKTQVKVFKGRFDPASYVQLDRSDSAAFLGPREAVVAAVALVNPRAAKSMTDADFGSNSGSINPEHSLNPRDGFGDNIIAVALAPTVKFAAATKVTAAEAAAFLIVHGAGHNANLQHAGDSNGYDPMTGRYTENLNVPHTPNIMTDGGVIVRRIESQYFAKELKVDRETLHMFVTAPGNRAKAAPGYLSIQGALTKRFDHDAPAAKLPVRE